MKTKTFKSLLLALVAAMLPQLASAHDFAVDGIYYNIIGNDATVTYRGDSYYEFLDEYTGAVNIPSTVTYNGITYSVTSIGYAAFWGCSGLTSIEIPNSVTSIGGSAFGGCSGLTSVTIPNSVISIGDDAFASSGLTSVTIPNSVASIGARAFRNCSGLTSVSIPNSVTTIAYGAFWGCSGLTSVTIGNSVTSIGTYAFYDCTGLTSVTIPNSVTSIGGSAFGGCSGLTSMVVESGNTKYDSRNNCNAIIETATNALIYGCKNTIIPNSVTSIGNSAFLKCSGLTSLTIPNLVTSIGDYAFYGCTGLTSVTIPNSVTSIGPNAFRNCSGLTSVTIGNSVTTIGEGAFLSCSGLTSVTIPNSVTSIGRYAFSGCSGLTSVTIPNSVTSIDNYAFYECTGLTSVTIPNSVTSIGAYAFYYCEGLTSVTLTGQGGWNYNSSRHSGLAQIINQLKIVNIGCGITSLGGSFGFTPDVVNCYAETPPACSSGTFANYDGELHVPTTSIAFYFMADYWQNFNNMINDLGKVTLDKSSASLIQWETLALTATVTTEGDEVIWSSTNPWVATVDENGVVTAIEGGECDIHATLASSHGAAYAICHITVNYPEITLSLSDENLEMNVGDEQTLTAAITPDNTGLTPTWSSSNTSVATVDANGKVIAIGEGECDIIATVLDQTATCHVTVTNNVTITLNVENAIMGASQMLTVYLSCTPDVPVELVVTSSDPSVAVARVVNRANAPAAGLKSFPEKGMALAMMEELAVPSESKDPALASTKAIMIVGVQNGTATITVSTADGNAEPAAFELRVVDVNGDNVVTAADVTALYDYLLNEDLTYYDTSDINGDGNITAADITALYNLLLEN